jgi:iron complex outermembrane receptor protein
MQSLKLLFTVLFLSLLMTDAQVFAQGRYQLSGTVTDEFRHPLAGATVLLQRNAGGTATDRRGRFSLGQLAAGTYVVSVSFTGYRTQTDTIVVPAAKDLEIKLCPDVQLLSELTVPGLASLSARSLPSMPVTVVDRSFINANASGSLMQTLGSLPGVGSMDIGSGQSKPVIRGMGFNRVVVAENGVKHEAQEWGADHGLEIDQFNIDYIEIVKGPASLMYGSNAIGGVIDLKINDTPSENSIGGKALINLQSNNDHVGASLQFFKRYQRFYYKAHLTMADYADYRVPTDTITYMTYRIGLLNNRLRNTAGRERVGSVTMGYLTDFFSTHLRVMNNYSRSGFFANAHGLEIRNSGIDYDASNRDIDLPSQGVNHLKLLSNSTWLIDDYKLNIDMAYQHNYRKEFSEAVAHGYMPLPPDSLERMYNKKTMSANFRLTLPKHDVHQFNAGLNVEHQDNRIGGWGFLLPEYRQTGAGAYLFDNMQLNESQSVNWGLRYDFAVLRSDAWYDWFSSPDDNGNPVFMQRAAVLRRNFSSLSWGVGTVRKWDEITLKVNAGKSFRMPTAKELSSNGVNYHMVRFERGDSTLKAEESYQLDFSMEYKHSGLNIHLTPFLNYFPNYIYLNPTSAYVHAQQIYHYSQSRVFRTGAELFVEYDISEALNLTFDAEYVFARQLSGTKRGYTLPFSPPFSSNVGLKYAPVLRGLKKPVFGVLMKMVASQNDIVPPEKKTPGYILFGLNAGGVIALKKHELNVNLRVDNVLNTRYYDHSSFYRLIEVPGIGRNIVLNIGLNF